MGAYALMALVVTASCALSGCYTVALDGRPCPCLNGFVCVDDVCVDPGDPPNNPIDRNDAGTAGDDDDDEDAGNTSDTDAGTDDPDSGEPPRPECTSDDDCVNDNTDPQLHCDRESGTCVGDDPPPPPGVCPDEFDRGDACAGALPQTALLADACGDARTVTTELIVALADLGSSCVLPGDFESALVATELQGFVGGQADTLVLQVSGTLTFDVTLAQDCFANGEGGACDANNDCVASDNACTCSLTVDHSREIQAQRAPGDTDDGVLFGSTGEVATCSEDASFTVREIDEESGLFGPVLVFVGILP